MLERQVERLEDYPQVEARLREHLRDKAAQLQRIEGILQDLGESPSGQNEAAALGGHLSTMTNAPATDGILKDSCAAYAMANLEIATYESLLVLGEAAGKVDAIRALQTSLSEERAMANWLAEHMRETTVMFLKTKSEKARRPATERRKDVLELGERMQPGRTASCAGLTRASTWRRSTGRFAETHGWPGQARP
ncbi:MAG: ferritin-like domain-containing protein [Magnetospirillum sp.]|nr:ferritin-like domain-containing protein [Magnetospirillum sp.]